MTDFPGKIGRTIDESTPWWPEPRSAEDLPPNVISIVLDDTGWSDLGCFGSEIRTPHIDALAKGGLRYTNFHVTPMCSPTRACFLTGRNHHNVGMKSLSDTDTGFPNGRGAVDADVRMLPETLRDHGFGTYMVGKWHLTPAHEVTPAGPHANWPISRGFERYYGFLGGCTDHYTPELIQDNQTIDPPERDGYHLSEDLADRAIGYLRDHATFRARDPFFLNIGFGATHAPIQVDRAWIDPYEEIFAKGWDETRLDRIERQKALGVLPGETDLAERNPEVAPWESLSQDARRVYTRLQSAFAGFLEHTDAQIGRLIAELKRLDLFDNTIILVFSDNGASREGDAHGAVDVNGPYSGRPQTVEQMVDRLDDVGGLYGPSHYPQGWAMAGNTPFRRYKQFVELGGVRSPLVVSWPMGIEEAGGIRDQFLHAIDLAPTLMDLVGDRRASAYDGASFSATLNAADAPAPRASQYWEMFGRRAIYCDGWKAVTEHEKGDDYGADTWRLYDTRADFSECHDVADRHPEIVAKLKDLWWTEAEANAVLPLDDRTLVDILVFRQPNGLMSQRDLTLLPGQGHIPQLSMITASERSMEVMAHMTSTGTIPDGVLISSGDDLGGYTLFVKKGELVFEHVCLGLRDRITAPLPCSVDGCGFVMTVAGDRTATLRLLADGAEIGQGRLRTTSGHLSFWGLDVGRDVGRAVSADYVVPFAFPVEALDRVVLRFFEDIDAETAAAMAEATE